MIYKKGSKTVLIGNTKNGYGIFEAEIGTENKETLLKEFTSVINAMTELKSVALANGFTK